MPKRESKPDDWRSRSESIIGESFQWESELRAKARADKYALFREHLRRLDLPSRPKLLLEGTIQVVRMALVFAASGKSEPILRRFLKMQRYNPAEATGVKYVVTFDLGVNQKKAFARVLVDADFQVLDLADLYNCPWSDLKTIGFGYSHLWISRPDWKKLSTRELRELKSHVTYDLRYDYGEEELSFDFDDISNGACLSVWLQDETEFEDEGED